MAKTKPLNVRNHLEWLNETCEDMLKRHEQAIDGGLHLAPIDVENLRKLRFMTWAILRKHKSKKTRKDLYVNRQADAD